MAHKSETYRVVAPDGKTLLIPKELYMALFNFIQTPNYRGLITVQFREGEITSVEPDYSTAGETTSA